MLYFYKKIFVFHKIILHTLSFYSQFNLCSKLYFAKDVMPDYIGPSGFILLRVLDIDYIFVNLYVFYKRKSCNQRSLKIAVCSMFGVAINQLFSFMD